MKRSHRLNVTYCIGTLDRALDFFENEVDVVFSGSTSMRRLFKEAEYFMQSSPLAVHPRVCACLLATDIVCLLSA